MARIQTYNIDNKVTSNDTWIGTDGDKQNKTKNFSPIGLANYFNTSEGVHAANSIAFRYQTLKPEDIREKGTISFKDDNSPTFNFSNIINILFSKFTLGNNEVDTFLLGLKDNTVILHRSGDINKYGLYKVLDVVEDEDEPMFLNFTLSFIRGNSYLQENERYLFSLIDLDVNTPSLQDVIDVDKNADRVRFYKDIFPITEWSTFNYMVSVAPSATDSRFYTYGDFTFGGVGNDIARFNPDGTYDTTFNVGTGLNNAPFSGATVLPLSDGKVYLSGSFTSYNGTTANRIIKLNENGSIDTSFDYGIGFNVTTTRVAVDSNDKIYVGSSGASGNYQGVSTGRLVRLNTDGTRDNTFSTGVGFNNTVIDVKLDSSDKVYVSGYFTTYQGTTARGIIRLNPDASIDTGFSYGTGVTNTGNNVVNNIELIQSEGKILLYGMLTGYNGTSANRIIKLNEDGTIEPTFLANIGTGFNDRVFEAKITSYGTILCTGSFTSYNGVTTNRSIELNLDGTIYKAFPQSSLYNAYLLNDDVFLGLTLNSGTYTLSSIIDYYPVNTKELTFSEVTGKAEYKIGGLDSTSEEELLPKRLIRELIQLDAPSTPIPTNTSSFINDGEDGINPYITANDVSSLSRQEFTYTTGLQEFTLLQEPSAIYNVFVNGQELLSTQYSVATDVLTIIDTLVNGDTISVIYSNVPVNVPPSYTKVETDNLLLGKEEVTNKATNLTSPDNTKYPTTQAVENEIKSIYPFNNVGNFFTLLQIPSTNTGVVFSSNANNSNNYVLFMPIFLNKKTLFDEFAITHNVANDGASGTMTLYLFDSSNDGLPGLKLHEEITATGAFVTAQKIISFTTNIELERGNYWIGLHIRGLNTSGGNPSFLGGVFSNNYVLGSSLSYSNNGTSLLRMTSQTADVGNNPTVNIQLSTSMNVPQIYAKL
jgi:uncharacterized delta-60 repeat protein